MRAFVVDDDPLSLFITKCMLAAESAVQEVSTFLSATDALQELQANKGDVPDVIFLDLNMPLMDGWQFLDALGLLETHLRKKFCVYILTSSLDLADTARSNEYPMVSGFLHKPITTEDIQVIMHQHSGVIS